MTIGLRAQRILLAFVLVGLAAYGEHRTTSVDESFWQKLTWTVGVFCLLFIQLKETLRRRIEASIMVTLLGIHLYCISRPWQVFPFRSFISVILGIVAESILVGLIYLRIAQALDPEGPLGPNEREKEARLRRLKL
jgi:hypothetical protein